MAPDNEAMLTDNEVNGYRHVKFHVEGTDFTTCTRRDIHDLQLTVSSLLMLPLADVLIAGIEPSSSLIITIMIPDSHADYLREMAESTEGIPELTTIGVDAFSIGDKTYNLHGVEEAEVVETEQQLKLVTVYKQLAEKTRQIDILEDREVESLKLQRKLLDEKTRQCQQLKQEMEMYTSSLQLNAYILGDAAYGVYVQQQRNVIALSKVETQTVSPLVKQSALAYFRFCLRAAMSTGHDIDILMQLLDANSKVISIRIAEDQHVRVQHLLLMVQSLQAQAFQLRLERELAHLVQAGPGRIVEGVLTLSIVQLLQALDPNIVAILKTISKQLRLKDRHKLQNKYAWTDGDKLKDAIDKYPDVFLECLVLKEMGKTGLILTTDQLQKFVSDCLIEVHRLDLKDNFHGLLAKHRRQTSKEPAMQQQQATGASVPAANKLEDEVSEILKLVQGMDKAQRFPSGGYTSWLGKDIHFPTVAKDLKTA